MLTPGVAARSTLSASAVTSGPFPSPPTTASLIVRESMPEPYWRAWLAAGRVAACSASPPLSRRSRAIWTAWAGEKPRRGVAGGGGLGAVLRGLFTERRGRGGYSPWLAESQGYMSYMRTLLMVSQNGRTASGRPRSG